MTGRCYWNWIVCLPLMATIAWADPLPEERLFSPSAPAYGVAVPLIGDYQRLVLSPDAIPTLASYERFVGSGAELEVSMELQACRLAGILSPDRSLSDPITAAAYDRCVRAVRPPSGGYDPTARSWYLTWVRSRIPHSRNRAKVREVVEVHLRSGAPSYLRIRVMIGGTPVRF